MVKQEKRCFKDNLDYITTFAYLHFGNVRQEFGSLGGVPSAVITNMGVFYIERETVGMYPKSCRPGVNISDIQERTDWGILNCKARWDPMVEQVEIVRELNPFRIYLGNGCEYMADVERGFDFYMEVL